ncbi:MAG TPA: hypothetical protein VF720_00865 [Candidatus Eisenbacteria bacterium]
MGRDTLDLVWDCDECGTVQSAAAGSLRVGGRDGWSPEHLVSVAAEADLMARFLQLAGREELNVLGYLSAVNLGVKRGDAGGFRVVVRPCVVLAGPAEEPAARRLLDRAFGESPVCRSLKAVRLEAAFVVEPGGRSGGV